MAQTADNFRKNAIESRLLTAEEIDYALSDLPPNQFPETGEKFARELIKRKLLTSFQAQEIYSGRLKTLVLGNYVVIDRIGQGGMGLVLKARHRLLKRLAAIKILPAAAAKDAEAIARFHREFFAAGQLQHANIVTAYDAAEANGIHFLALEYVDGKDLASYVKATGPMDVALAMRCILQAAKGLEYAHRQGVIHRDIKPHNLLIDGAGNVKILDMGLARFEALAGAPSTELTNTGAIMGTVDYMAPEQAMNTKDADGRSDVYSLGATLWFLLTGQQMYQGDSMMARLLAHRDLPIPSLELQCPGVPRALVTIFERMVAKSPTTRFASMSEVIEALEPLVSGQGSETTGDEYNSLYRDPNLLAFFANMEAERINKVLAAPIVDKADLGAQTVAIAGSHADTKQLAKRNSKPAASEAITEVMRRSAGSSLPLVIGAVGGAIGLVAVVALIVVMNLPTREEARRPSDDPAKSESKQVQGEAKATTPPKVENQEPKSTPVKVEPPPVTRTKETKTPGNENTTTAPPKTPKEEFKPNIASKTAVDLLAQVSPQKGFQLPDQWRLDSGELTSAATGSVLNLKIAPLTSFHYRVDCELTLLSQGDAFYVVLPVGNANLHWAINAYTKPNIDLCRCGFGAIDGKDLRTSPAGHEAARLIVGERHRIRIEVQATGDQLRLSGQVDDEAPREWKGAKSQVSLPATYDWPEKELLGCGVVNSAYRIHQFKLTPLE